MDPEVLSVNPQILVFDDFVTDDVIDHIIESATGNLEAADIFVSGDERAVHKNRSNSHCPIQQWEDPIARELCDRVAELVRLPPECAEALTVLRYETGQQYDLHQDAHPFEAGKVPEILLTRGQRLFTSLIYLNDDFEGGATEFPRIDVTVQPRKGRMVLWSNTVLGGFRPHPLSLHAGLPVVRGEKWAASLWWRRPVFPEPALWDAVAAASRR